MMALTLSVVTFTSCSSDDDDSSIAFDLNTIVGTWEITDVSGDSEKGWAGDWIEEGKTLKFNNDGTCETGDTLEDSYKIVNGLVITYFKEYDEPMLIYKLLTKNGDVLKVKVNGTLDESNLSVTIQMKKK